MTIQDPYFHETASGATTAGYVAVITMIEGSGAVFVVKNTHVSATMKYKAVYFMSSDDDALEQEATAETSLGAATSSGAISTLNIPFYKAIIYVKYNSGAGTYQVDAKMYV